jgi:Tol biopolymer transport system component
MTGFVDGRPQIFVARSDGSGATVIGDRVVEGQEPVWSPDGTRIAFRGGRADKERSLYVMNADGSSIRPVFVPHDDPIGNAYSYWTLAWSPDGTRIAYQRLAGPNASQI